MLEVKMQDEDKGGSSCDTMVGTACSVPNRYVPHGEDGRIPMRKQKRREVINALPEIGECILHPSPQPLGKDMLDTRWENGVFAGVREASGNLHVMRGGGDQAQEFPEKT